MKILPIALAALALGGAAPEGRPGPWRVERIEARCTLLRQEPGATPLFLSLDTAPGTGLLRLIVADPAWSEYQAAEAAGMPFLLDPGGPVAGETSRPIRNAAGGGVEMTGIDESSLAALAAARSIRLEANGKTALRLQLPEAEAGVGALRACQEETLRQWGIDPAARASLGRLPKPAGAGAIEWFRWQDYPKEAVRARASGTVVARVAVDSSGGWRAAMWWSAPAIPRSIGAPASPSSSAPASSRPWTRPAKRSVRTISPGRPGGLNEERSGADLVDDP